MSIDDAARDRLREAIIDLMICAPDSWPELLAAQAGAACQMDVGDLNLLADAATQVAAMAHRMQLEAENEHPWQDPEAN